jgi:hypothetical protein
MLLGFGFRPPCADPTARRDQRLAALLDEPDADARLAEHVAGCAGCGEALAALRADRAALAGLGDAPGAAPDEAELRRVLAAVALDRAVRRWPLWPARAAAAAAAAVLIVLVGLGARQLLLARARAADDAAILVGADAAFRRAEREYTAAVDLLRAQLDRRGTPDARVAEGARALADARQRAASLAAERRGDPEREALLRDALRAEVRYYEDALMRAGVAPEPAP